MTQGKKNYAVDTENLKNEATVLEQNEVNVETSNQNVEEAAEKEQDVVKVEALETRSSSGKRSLDSSLSIVFKPDFAQFNPDDFTEESINSMKAGPKVKPYYFIFDQIGDKNRGMFLGFQELSKRDVDGKPLEAAVFGNHDGFWMNSGAALVSDLKDYATVGNFYEIEFLKKDKTTNKNDVFIYSIRQLYK